MPPQNPPQNASPSASWTLEQDSEATHVSAGYRDALTFVLVPRTRVEFAAPPRSQARQLEHSGELLIEFPVKGKAVHFEPGVTLDCDFSWVVKHDDVTLPKTHPVANAKMVIAQDGSFEVKVNGRPPVLDVMAHRLIKKGQLGYSLSPHFPHAEPATFEPAIPFENPCAITVKKPQGEACKVGELVTFEPEFPGVLNKADLELRVVELDEGSSEIAFGPDRYAFSYRWAPAALWLIRYDGSPKWAIGFSNDTCEHFADVGDEEEGSYEFGWQLWGRSQEGGPQTLLLEDKDFLRLAKPKLEDLRVEHDKSWEGTWEIHGKISGVSPRARLVVEVALVEPPAPAEGAGTTLGAPAVPQAPTPLGPQAHPASATSGQRSAPVRVRLQSDGVFEANLGERHMMLDWSVTSPLVAPIDTPKAYAVLTLPAAARDGKPGAIAPYLDFDDTKYSPFKADALCWDFDAEWVCSVEATSMVARPPKPTRRRSGVTPRPAPPVEAGDQKTAITWEEAWVDIVAWENIVPYMYRDSEGNVTVGAGNLLKYIEPKKEKDPLAARLLPFQNMDEARVATAAEVTEAFNKVMSLPPNLKYTAYGMRPKIALTDADIKALAKGRYEGEFLKAIKNGLPDYETYPRAARRGIFDVAYNVGISVPLGSNTKWKAFLLAVKARKWEEAAKECNKNKPDRGDEQRTVWREGLFRHAAKVDWKKPAT